MGRGKLQRTTGKTDVGFLESDFTGAGVLEPDRSTQQYARRVCESKTNTRGNNTTLFRSRCQCSNGITVPGLGARFYVSDSQ